MAKIMVFQHVPYEPLGTLDPLIRSQRHRIRYVNFGREPNAKPDICSYDALIILGGPMNIGQEDEYPHLVTEQRVIRQAMQQDIPVLGICLGAQLIAAAAGAKVYQAPKKEIGWYPITPTQAAQNDPVLGHFDECENIFQWHGYTFDLPKNATLLATGEQIAHQAFQLKNNVYGFQFHLETDLSLIQRWLKLPQHLKELGLDKAKARVDSIWQETHYRIDRSLALSHKVFNGFLSLLPKVNEKHQFIHRDFLN
ncbi:glutamine amidotransferase-related protein [Aliikangiella maris]|uniref:Gamma-glutamyl-gamma-aminobutyrate hydrolase family protein n=2 Tax=Aliikangiella maris TaxID=3162458 RepID=A0ABV3MKN9_9GAMM